MKKILSFILAALLPVVACAFDAYVDGISYNLSGDEAVVTFMEYDSYNIQYISDYTGNIALPASITYNGKTYRVTGIGNGAFADCKDLKSVTIPESVITIGGGAFSSSGLTSIIIPESVTTLGGSAFYDCSSLVSATIPGSVTSIESNTFLNCRGLTSVTLGDGVASIGEGAFWNCSSLTSVNIPNSVTSMESAAFEGCGSLTDVTIPGSVTNIGNGAFKNCSSLTSLTIEDGVKIIGGGAFYNCNMSSVIIPGSVTSIGIGAFSNCSSLADVTVPENVTSVGVEAFNGTPWFDDRPDGLVYIGKVAYKYKGGMPEGTEIPIQEGTVQIAEEAFYERGGLTAIQIPGSVTDIGPNAFSGCSGLTAIRIPENLTSISEGVFGRCSSLSSVTIPNSVTSIGDNSFCNCTNLTSVNIGCNVESIGKDAFAYCRSLTSITIPESVTDIGGWAFFNCTGLTSVTIASSVKSIGRSAFYGCSGLTVICIPKSVDSIGRAAFSECDGLKDVYCLAENVPSTEKNAFNKSPISVATLHVPAGSVEKYKATVPWNGFGNIVALPAQEPLSFLEGNPTWVYKYEHISTPRDPNLTCWVDTGDRSFIYYFLGGQKEIEGKVYTMMGEITSRGEEDLIAFNRWYPIREENGIVYTITDSLPGIVEHEYNEDYEIPYLQQGNECVLYNFGAEIGDKLDKNNTVKSFDSYQLMDGTECRVLKTGTHYDLYEKLGYRDDDWTYGLIDPLFGRPIATNGHVYVNRLNVFYLDNVMLYKAPDAQEGLCVNDTCWTREDAGAYARSYKADPCQEEVFSYIRQLQKASEVDPVTYTKDQMATIILPTVPDAEKGKYYRLDRREEGKIIFEQEKQPQAHIPYIIVPNEDFSIDTGTLDLAGLSPDTVSIGGIDFIGSYSREEPVCREGWYIDIIDTTPDCKAEEGKAYTIGALRAYLTVNWDDPINHEGTKGPGEKMEVVLHDNGTNIASPLREMGVGAAIYDLSGRRILGNPARGIYLMNGKKTVIK